MFMKCCNPNCETPFDYRRGRLIRISRAIGGMLPDLARFRLRMYVPSALIKAKGMAQRTGLNPLLAMVCTTLQNLVQTLRTRKLARFNFHALPRIFR